MAEIREHLTKAPLHEALIDLRASLPEDFDGERFLELKFTSQDEKQIVQFRIDGFTLNRIRPYTNWKELFPEALRLWKYYLDFTSVDHVPRVAVRHINRIDLPLPVKDFRDHLTVPPDIPEGLPQMLSSFLTRVVIEDNETKASAIVTQALEKGLDDQTSPLRWSGLCFGHIFGRSMSRCRRRTNSGRRKLAAGLSKGSRTWRTVGVGRSPKFLGPFPV